MKSIRLIIINLIILSCVAGCSTNPSSSNVKLTSQRDSVYYYMGYLFGQNFNDPAFEDPNMKALIAGLNDAKKKVEIDKDINSIQMYITEYISDFNDMKAQENIQKGKDFLANNLKNKDVMELVDGIQYKVIVQGNGAFPKESDQVRVNYKGTTIDGVEFDSTEKRGTPATFRVDGVIKGWTKCLLHMPVGSKWMVYIPEDQAYGSRPIGSSVPGYSTLIFEIELLEILTK